LVNATEGNQVTNSEHMIWLATAMQLLSYEVERISKAMSKTVSGESIYNRTGADDPGFRLMSPQDIRMAVVNSLESTLSSLRSYHMRDGIP
jgi:hypothetical protein